MRLSKQVDTLGRPKQCSCPCRCRGWTLGNEINTQSRKTEVLIFQRPFVRRFAWTVRSTQEARWATLVGGSVVGSFHGLAWGSGESPRCGCPLILAPGAR